MLAGLKEAGSQFSKGLRNSFTRAAAAGMAVLGMVGTPALALNYAEARAFVSGSFSFTTDQTGLVFQTIDPVENGTNFNVSEIWDGSQSVFDPGKSVFLGSFNPLNFLQANILAPNGTQAYAGSSGNNFLVKVSDSQVFFGEGLDVSPALASIGTSYPNAGDQAEPVFETSLDPGKYLDVTLSFQMGVGTNFITNNPNNGGIAYSDAVLFSSFKGNNDIQHNIFRTYGGEQSIFQQGNLTYHFYNDTDIVQKAGIGYRAIAAGYLNATPAFDKNIVLLELPVNLAPVPEPTTYGMMGLGMLAVLTATRRRRAFELSAA